jgi:hypothetical protein
MNRTGMELTMRKIPADYINNESATIRISAMKEQMRYKNFMNFCISYKCFTLLRH